MNITLNAENIPAVTASIDNMPFHTLMLESKRKKTLTEQVRYNTDFR